MRKLLHTAAQLLCGVWLGGLIALFIFVITLFHEDHALAVQAAPKLFAVFEKYQLLLAGAALVCVIPLQRLAVTGLLFLAFFGAIASPLYITPRIVQLQVMQQTHTPQFARLHGDSMLIYTADAVLLLGAALILSYKPSH
jgi:hypothetical protein